MCIEDDPLDDTIVKDITKVYMKALAHLHSQVREYSQYSAMLEFVTVKSYN